MHGLNRYNQLFDQIQAERETTRARIFEDNLLRHFQREEEENNSKKKRGVPKEAPPMPIPRHELWATDTIVTTARTKKTPLQREKDDSSTGSSSEEDNEEEDRLPDYSRSNEVTAHAV